VIRIFEGKLSTIWFKYSVAVRY